VVAQGVDAVVVVRGVNQQTGAVTLQGLRGNVFTMQVPPEAQNLDPVYAGANSEFSTSSG